MGKNGKKEKGLGFFGRNSHKTTSRFRKQQGIYLTYHVLRDRGKRVVEEVMREREKGVVEEEGQEKGHARQTGAVGVVDRHTSILGSFSVLCFVPAPFQPSSYPAILERGAHIRALLILLWVSVTLCLLSVCFAGFVCLFVAVFLWAPLRFISAPPPPARYSRSCLGASVSCLTLRTSLSVLASQVYPSYTTFSDI